MKTKQTKRKVYRSMLEIAKAFFPELYNKLMEARISDDPRDIGARIAEEALQEAKRLAKTLPPARIEGKMRSEEIEILLKRSKKREKRFRELNAPQAMLEAEARIQRNMYLKKIIDYSRVFRKLTDKMRGLACKDQNVKRI